MIYRTTWWRLAWNTLSYSSIIKCKVCNKMVHNIHYTYKIIQTLQWVPNFAAECIMDTKKVGILHSSINFCEDNTWNEKRLLLSYSSAPMIAKAYHIRHHCKDVPKFPSTIPSYAVEPKNWGTMYGRPFNVGTFRFCWCTRPCRLFLFMHFSR